MDKFGKTQTYNETTHRMITVNAPRHTFADADTGLIDYDAKTKAVVLHGSNDRDYIPSGKHFKTKAEARHAAMRSGVTGSVVDVNHKDPFNGGYEIYYPLVSPRAPIVRPAAFAGTKIAIPSGTTELVVAPERKGPVHRARGGLTRRK
jgi:hypothetical protein